MIVIEGLEKRYKSAYALRGVDLHVPRGELFAYLGPNGAGKTTTIRILAGLTLPTSGKVHLNGVPIHRNGPAARRLVGVVPQSINLDQELTVFENMDIHGRLFGMPGRKRRARIEEMLHYVELSERSRSLVKELSGGLKRRLMIARALVHSPAILFLDEPSVGLDAAVRRRIWGLIRRVQRLGTTIFLTTHYIEEAEFLADRVAFLDQGRIVALDRPRPLMDAVGAWALDRVGEDGIETRYFERVEEARRSAAERDEGFTLRRVNLEDAFLSLTGKKVQ